MQEGNYIPNVDFMIRVANPAGGDAQPFTWTRLNSYKIFNNHKTVLFCLPGAFTPICTERQVPDYDNHFFELKSLGITQVLCLTVNDYWVVKQWADSLRTRHVKFIPDGNGVFTQQMGMLVDKSNYGYGNRSWRYAAVIDNSKIEKIFEEPGKSNNSDVDPYSETHPRKVIEYLRNKSLTV